jgi:hypothetical protein
MPDPATAREVDELWCARNGTPRKGGLGTDVCVEGELRPLPCALDAARRSISLSKKVCCCDETTLRNAAAQ